MGWGYLFQKDECYLFYSILLDVCFIQEIKLQCFSDLIAEAFWGNKEVEWTTCNSIGEDGGMFILWRKGSLSLNYSFVGKCYVGVNID